MATVLPKENGGDFETVPTGTFPATCYRLVELGTQQVEWEGKTKHQFKIMLSWELAEEKMSDGRPFSVHQRYTLSSSDKSKLRKDLESWRGAAFSQEDFGKFDISVLVGKPCLLGIVHKTKDGKTYSNISSILRLPKAMPAPEPVNEPLYFSLSEFDQDVFNRLSESLQAVVAKSPEYQDLKGVNQLNREAPDDGYHGDTSRPDDEIGF